MCKDPLNFLLPKRNGLVQETTHKCLTLGKLAKDFGIGPDI